MSDLIGVFCVRATEALVEKKLIESPAELKRYRIAGSYYEQRFLGLDEDRDPTSFEGGVVLLLETSSGLMMEEYATNMILVDVVNDSSKQSVVVSWRKKW